MFIEHDISYSNIPLFPISPQLCLVQCIWKAGKHSAVWLWIIFEKWRPRLLIRSKPSQEKNAPAASQQLPTFLQMAPEFLFFVANGSGNFANGSEILEIVPEF